MTLISAPAGAERQAHRRHRPPLTLRPAKLSWPKIAPAAFGNAGAGLGVGAGVGVGVGVFGSTGSMHLSAPIVAMAAIHSGRGYWLVSSDGGVFGFGNAPFLGGIGGQHLNKPINGLTSNG